MLTFNFHIGDWIKATQHLTRIERDIYVALLTRYYDTEEPLPADRTQVCRLVLARSDEDIAAVDAVLDEFFTLDDTGYRNKRADEELARYHEKCVKASRSASARWQKAEGIPDAGDTDSEGNADAMRTHSEGNANHEPRTTNHKPEDKKPLSAGADVALVFDHWRIRMNHAGAKLDDKRRKTIQKALKLGYTTSDLIEAIDGCAKSPWHMGQNDRHIVYDGIDLILRNADKIDGFIKTNRLPTQAGGPHATSKPALTGAAARNAEVSAAIRQLRTGTARTGTAGGSGDFCPAAGGNAGQVFEHVPDE